MDTTSPDTLMDMHAHRDWANRQIIAWWLALPNPEAHPLRLLSHVLLAEAVWLNRLEGHEAKGDIWASLAKDDLMAMTDSHKIRFEALLRSETGARRSRVMKYHRLNGDAMENTWADIVTHVATHGVHHRAQITAWGAANGHPAPSLDYIRYAMMKPTI